MSKPLVLPGKHITRSQYFVVGKVNLVATLIPQTRNASITANAFSFQICFSDTFYEEDNPVVQKFASVFTGCRELNSS